LQALGVGGDGGHQGDPVVPPGLTGPRGVVAARFCLARDGDELGRGEGGKRSENDAEARHRREYTASAVAVIVVDVGRVRMLVLHRPGRMRMAVGLWALPALVRVLVV